ncbi:T9SS type A sorting domain-containing protein [candidate division KSB1 bacterium]|nr:T9SS type A sorting domain-containing protein [candidate division KSB1 bacterium]
MKTFTVFNYLVVLVTAVSFGLAQTPVVETFDYPAGDLAGCGAAENGWGGPWEVFEGPAENMFIIDGSLEYPALSVAGNQLVGISPSSGGCRAARSLETTWLDDPGADYWISFLMEIENVNLISGSWQGVSLWLDYGEVAYFGKNWGNDNWGIIGDLGSLNYPSPYEYFDGCAWLVAKIEMSGDDTNEMAYLWVNPDPSVEPDMAEIAVSGECSILDNGFNQIVCHLGMSDGITCFYDEIRVGTSFADVSPEFASVDRHDAEFPDQIELSQNYPNPFNANTTIGFHLRNSDNISIKIYNLTGQEIATLADGYFAAGQYEAKWEASGQPSGIYLYTLKAGNFTETRKLLLQK